MRINPDSANMRLRHLDRSSRISCCRVIAHHLDRSPWVQWLHAITPPCFVPARSMPQHLHDHVTSFGPREIHALTFTWSRHLVWSPRDPCYNIHMIMPPRSVPARSMLQHSHFTKNESCHLVRSPHDSKRNDATPEKFPTRCTGTQRPYIIL